MKSLKYLAIIFLAIVIVSCANKKTEQIKQVESERVYNIKTQVIKKIKVQKTLDFTADLIPFKEINCAPAAPGGRIEKINVEIGSRVKKGQILVEFENTQLTQAKTQLETAELNFRRIDTLHQLGSISEQQYEQVKAQYKLAKSNVDFLMKNTTLTSSINGIVTSKYFENGEVYSGVPNTPSGKAAVVSLVQINQLKAIVNISERYFSIIKQGMEADIYIDIYPNKNFKGMVHKIYPTIDKATKTFKTELLISNTSEELRPGMFAKVKIKTQNTDAIVVPAISILKQEGTNNRFVFVNNKGIAKKIAVELGNRFDDMIEIRSTEIKEGLNLIVEGQANLLDGSKINDISANIQ